MRIVSVDKFNTMTPGQRCQRGTGGGSDSASSARPPRPWRCRRVGSGEGEDMSLPRDIGSTFGSTAGGRPCRRSECSTSRIHRAMGEWLGRGSRCSCCKIRAPVPLLTSVPCPILACSCFGGRVCRKPAGRKPQSPALSVRWTRARAARPATAAGFCCTCTPPTVSPTDALVLGARCSMLGLACHGPCRV